MDLQALNSGPTPAQKAFLNPICGSITSGISTSSFDVQPASLQSSPANLYSTTPNTLAASDLPSGVGTYVANGAQAVQLPTAAQLNTYFAPAQQEVKSFHFPYNINVRSGAGNLTATFGTGAIGYDNSTSITVVAGNKNQIFYSWNSSASPQWVVYF